jgi:hypothetical protein
MIDKGFSLNDIIHSGKLEKRTPQAIAKQIERLGFVRQKKNFAVGQIREAEIVGLESIVKRYVDAFNKICDLTEYDKQDLERFRIIFMAAWKYRALFADYERLKQVENEIAELRKTVEEVKAQLAGPAEAHQG